MNQNIQSHSKKLEKELAYGIIAKGTIPAPPPPLSPSFPTYTKYTAQKLKFPIKEFSSKNDQIRSFL